MAKVTTKEELSEYVLRNLGQGVINIEVSAEQVADRIDDTIDFFIERHYLGVDEAILYYTVSREDFQNGYAIIPEEFLAITGVYTPNYLANRLNNSGVVPWDSLEFQMEDVFRNGVESGYTYELANYYIAREHFSTMRTLMEVRRQFTHNPVTQKFIPKGWQITDVQTYNRIMSGPDLTDDTYWTLLPDTVVTNDTAPSPSGRMVLSTISGSALTQLGASQEIDLRSYFDNKPFTGMIQLQKGDLYDGLIDVEVKDEHNNIITTMEVQPDLQLTRYHFEFTMQRSMGSKITVSFKTRDAVSTLGDTIIYSSISLWKNPVMILEGYKKVIPDQDVLIYNDKWIKSMATALVGMQHGKNLSKMSGINLPGGVQIDGDKIYDRYKTDYDKLKEDFTSFFEMPIDMVVA